MGLAMETDLVKLSPGAVLAQELSFLDTTLSPAAYVSEHRNTCRSKKGKESHRGQVKSSAPVFRRVVIGSVTANEIRLVT